MGSEAAQQPCVWKVQSGHPKDVVRKVNALPHAGYSWATCMRYHLVSRLFSLLNHEAKDDGKHGSQAKHECHAYQAGAEGSSDILEPADCVRSY